MLKKANIRTKIMGGFATLALVAVLTGIAGIYFVNRVGSTGYDAAAKLAPAVDAAMEIRLASAMANTIFENIMSGNDSEDIEAVWDEAVWDLLDKAEWYCDAILQGGSNEEGIFYASEDAEVIAKIKEAKKALDDFVQSAHTRYDNRDTAYAAISKDAELAYDTNFEIFNGAVDEAEEIIKTRMVQGLEDLDTTIYNTNTIMIVVSVAALFFALLMGAVLSNMISKPLKTFVQLQELMAKGDFTVNVDSGLTDRSDEIGELSQSLFGLTESMRGLLGELIAGTHTLSSASTELMTISEGTAAGSRETVQRTNSISAAAEEMSVNTSSVATGMQQATANLNSVSSAVEEMSATIGDIAGSSERAHNTTAEAARQADLFASVMKELGAAAQEIGKVTETITSISAQTNLLALNATIEAARAGAAGKGFAVVASEIKELAQQTAAATDEIKARIGSVQKATTGAVTDLEKIVRVIGEVNEIVVAISASIQEQSTATQDVAINIAQASSGMKEANEHVSQTASAAETIARDIAEVDLAVSQMSYSSDQVQASAAELSGLSEKLSQSTSLFKV